MKNKTKKPFIQKMIEDFDENWFSFFSGILSNIPISLLLGLQPIGESILDYWFFILLWVAFAFSVVVVFCAISFTIKKIDITKKAHKEYSQWVASNNTQSITKEEECLHNEFLKNRAVVRTIVAIFIIFFLLTLGTLGSMWVLFSIK